MFCGLFYWSGHFGVGVCRVLSVYGEESDSPGGCCSSDGKYVIVARCGAAAAAAAALVLLGLFSDTTIDRGIDQRHRHFCFSVSAILDTTCILFFTAGGKIFAILKTLTST